MFILYSMQSEVKVCGKETNKKNKVISKAENESAVIQVDVLEAKRLSGRKDP